MALSGASFGTDVWSNNVICGKYDCGHDPSINHLWLNHPSLLPVQRGEKKNPIMHLVTYGLPSLYVCRMWQQENDSACTQTRNSCAEAPPPPSPPVPHWPPCSRCFVNYLQNSQPTPMSSFIDYVRRPMAVLHDPHILIFFCVGSSSSTNSCRHGTVALTVITCMGVVWWS